MNASVSGNGRDARTDFYVRLLHRIRVDIPRLRGEASARITLWLIAQGYGPCQNRGRAATAPTTPCRKLIRRSWCGLSFAGKSDLSGARGLTVNPQSSGGRPLMKNEAKNQLK